MVVAAPLLLMAVGTVMVMPGSGLPSTLGNGTPLMTTVTLYLPRRPAMPEKSLPTLLTARLMKLPSKIELLLAAVETRVLAPVLLPLPLQLVPEGQTLACTVRAVDADNDATRLALIYDASTPACVSFDPDTAEVLHDPLRGLLAPDTAHTVNGKPSGGFVSYTVRVRARVRNGERTNEVAFRLEVR